MRTPTDQEARDFIDASTFIWHQQFRLSPGVVTPGANIMDNLLLASDVPSSLAGQSVLDIGTTNGAIAFECERRGASRVVAVDILDPEHFGFATLAQFLESDAQFVQCSVYEIADVLQETFDLVIFWGVLYHLRHPLLGLDGVRRVARGAVTLETAVTDWQDGQPGPLARFHRLDDLGNDFSNWWSPTVEALQEWCNSAGFDVANTVTFPEGAAPQRALMGLRVTGDEPEYIRVSYETPLEVVSGWRDGSPQPNRA